MVLKIFDPHSGPDILNDIDILLVVLGAGCVFLATIPRKENVKPMVKQIELSFKLYLAAAASACQSWPSFKPFQTSSLILSCKAIVYLVMKDSLSLTTLVPCEQLCPKVAM